MESICNRIAILHNGVIIIEGTPDKLKDGYTKNEEIHLVTRPGRYDKIVKRLDSKDIKEKMIKRNKLVIYTPNAERVLHKLIHVIESMDEKLVDVDVKKPTLEEVFEARTRK
jgi:ABC-type multidrug transport system ATPase subunit